MNESGVVDNGEERATGADWEYAPAPQPRELAKLQSRYRMFLGGEFAEGSGEPLPSVEPATEETLAEVTSASAADVDRAVRSARNAYDRVWGRMAGAERAKYLFRLARLVQERSRELAVLETLDSGKPVRESRDWDLPAAATQLFHHAGWADKLEYALPEANPAPIGVAGQVIPCSFPLALAAARIAPALACGNTVVLKPAPSTPLTALVLGELCQQAGLPAGVVNVLPGGDDVGAELVSHADVDTVAFTGSTDAGRTVQHALAGGGKRLCLDLGGGSAHVVFDDAPLDQAVEGIVDGFTTSQGQARWAGSRLLVQESIAEELLERLRQRVSAVRVGDPLDVNTDMGALDSTARLEKVRQGVEQGAAEGARRWTSPCSLPDRGFYFPPTVLSQVHQSMRIAREEIPGPVLAVLSFRTPEEAIAKVNNTPHGLSAGVWTEKASRMLWTAQRVRAGTVWANTFQQFDPSAPFGGYGESGFGRSGERAGLRPYLTTVDGGAR